MATARENNMSCAVCLELYDDPRILPCGHSYCLKCLLDLSRKISKKGLLKCPICQNESSSEYSEQASYTRNFELNSLVQSYIFETTTRDAPSEAYCCQICDYYPAIPAQRACVECEMMYLRKVFQHLSPYEREI